MRRVVVTGMGLVTPLGAGVDRTWRNLLESKSGVRRITAFDTSELPVSIAGVVPRGKGAGELDADAFFAPREQRRYGEFIVFALAAANEALADSGYAPATEEARDRTGVAIGSGIGGIPFIEESAIRRHEGGARKVSPFFIPGSLVNEAAGVIAIRHGFRGPNHAVATACATGAHSIGDASRMIAFGDADVMVAGGTEAGTCPLTISGFAIMRALSTDFEAEPERASRPWDRDRDGFVLGEGAGVMVLEEREHAIARGARIHAELLGYGLTGDAYHLTSPAPDGNGAIRAMRAALARARLDPSEIDYVNAHATSTPVGDPIEIHAVRTVFAEHASKLSMSSTKSATGHLLGAAGSVEAIVSILALRDQVAPPTLNLEHPPDDPIDLVPVHAKSRRIRYALSNSFAFGGANATLIFGPP